MAPLPSRKSLEAMRRVDLQRICKDYGVKANLKSEALINLLLDTQSTPAHQSVQPTRRSVSTRQSSRAGPSRVSSMIVHDISDDDAERILPEITEEVLLLEPSTEAAPSVLPPARTRKAKELQTRLGVGKPIVAGGHGPRAVTRSSGSSRGKRAKSSRSLKPTEDTIEEEAEPLSVPPKEPEHTQAKAEERNEPSPQNSPSADLRMGNVKKIVEDAILPFQDQIHILKSELNGVQSIRSDIAELQVQVADVCKTQKDLKVELESLRELSLIVVSLKEEIRQLREGFGDHPPTRPSTPKVKSGQQKHGLMGFGLPSAFKNIVAIQPNAASRSSSILPHPGIAESTLGKRHRDSTGSNVTGVVEEGQEDEYSDSELAKKVVRPTKKRPRTNVQAGASTRIPSMEDVPEAGSSNSCAVPTFTVFRGSEEPSDYIDPPPPTDHVADFFHPESPSSSNSNVQRSRSVPTSSANAAENLPHGFNFAFLPISSTPNNGHYMPSFPYPEPPQSPSPAGPSSALYMSRQDERTDIFKSFGLPSPVRATRNYGALTQEDRGGFVNPAALTQGSSGKQREVSTGDADATDPPPSKRTMYGTELEGDTRFGDFGLEGMATNYWASGKF